MRDFLMRRLPASIIVYMARKMEKLTEKELRAQVLYGNELHFLMDGKTKVLLIVAITGLVGSGKSAVANYLSRMIDATVISADKIRIKLREQGAGYDNARLIAENLLRQAIKLRTNVIMDSDFVDRNKRASLEKIAKETNVRLIFIRTHGDIDEMIKRICKAKYSDVDFFTSAELKLREMLRRLPQHYRWINSGGGKWLIRKMSGMFAEIDTTDENRWKAEVRRIAEKFL